MGKEWPVTPITYCVDFDDLVDNALTQTWRGGVVYLVDWLEKWAARYEGLKVTLFTPSSPRRISDATIALFKQRLPWAALAPHGHIHSRGECLSWGVDEAVAKITLAKERGIDAPTFRAPGWLLDGDVYVACKELGYTVASHTQYRIPNTGVKEYIYNRHDGASPMRVRRVHGHITPVSGNHLYDMHHDGWLKFKKGATFVYPWEVGVAVNDKVLG